MIKVFLIIFSIMFYFFITFITNTLNIFYPYTNVLLSGIFIIVVFTIYFKKYNYALISYIIFSLVFLFYRRKVSDNINSNFYLFEWLSLVFKNRIVLINLLGNLLLFMPYVFLIRSKYYLLIIICCILGLEIIQYITKRGVLDIVDIVLNIFGCMLVIPFRWRFYERRKEIY
ncbi:MAG: VanZ family protein [Bacilli bacterium]